MLPVVQQAEMYFRVAAFGRLRLRQGDAAQEDAGGGNCETAALPHHPVHLQSACLSSSLSSPNLLFLGPAICLGVSELIREQATVICGCL